MVLKTKPKRRWFTQYPRHVKRDRKADPTPPVRDAAAPKIRADCEDGPRPCPWVACKYHLFTDVTYAGGIRFGFGEDVSALYDMPETCALDVADEGTHQMPQIAAILATTQQDIAHKEEDLRAHLRSLETLKALWQS